MPDVLRRHLDTAPFQNTRPDEDPARGHYLFLMPPGRSIGNSPGRLTGGWGDIRGLNGIIVVAPHPDGRRWLRTGPVPVLPAELAELLPDASAATDAASDAVVRAFIAEHQSSTDPAMLTGLTSTLRRKFEAGESRHTSTVSVLTGAMKEARIGLYTPRLVIDTIWPLFLAAVTREPTSARQGRARSIAAATDEFRGIAAWAVGQALGADPDEIRKRVRRIRRAPHVHYGQTLMMRKVTR